MHRAQLVVSYLDGFMGARCPTGCLGRGSAVTSPRAYWVACTARWAHDPEGSSPIRGLVRVVGLRYRPDRIRATSPASRATLGQHEHQERSVITANVQQSDAKKTPEYQRKTTVITTDPSVSISTLKVARRSRSAASRRPRTRLAEFLGSSSNPSIRVQPGQIGGSRGRHPRADCRVRPWGEPSANQP